MGREADTPLYQTGTYALKRRPGKTSSGFFFNGKANAYSGTGRIHWLDTIEVYDELEDIIRGGFRRAGLIDLPGQEDIAHLHIGDAKKIIPTLDKMYDIVYIDANKREYIEYYNLVFDKVRPGGYILADNVLWSGKVLLDNPPKDAQTQSIIAFNKLVAADPRVDNTILPIRDGINVIYKL